MHAIESRGSPAWTGASAGIAGGRGKSQANSSDESPSAFLIATVMRAGLDRPVTRRLLRRLIDLRASDEFDGLRTSFVDAVDAHIAELGSASELELPLIVGDWQERLDKDRR